MGEKFTPGPWEFDGEDSGYYDLPTFNIKDKGGYIVAGAVDYGSNSDPNNAHLIAAAPELYEALKSVMDEISSCLSNETHYFGTTTPFDAARSALAKARGES